jgi:hypothetical protein
MLSGEIERQDNNGNDITGDPTGDPSINLAQDFFDPTVINTNGSIDPVSGHITSDIAAFLKGNADGVAQANDVLAINEVRNLLFANGGLMDNGQDLIARDIQRARDDGIGTYNQVRVAFGLKPVTSFAQITSNVALQKELQQAYGSVDNIDPFEGGMAEDHVSGSDLGPLFTTILSDQFSRLENGDRFFYRNETFTSAERAMMQQGNTLGEIIENNTNITNLQPDVFKFTASISGTVSSPGRFGNGLAGITVQLQDDSGDVLATTVTNRNGNYTFTQQSGPSANPEIGSGVSATGDYQIVLVLPRNLHQVGQNPGPIHISRGGLNIKDVDFTVFSSGHSSSSSSGTSSAAPAAAASPMTAASSPGGVFSSGGVLTISSSAAPAASSEDVTPSATTTSIAMALSNSAGSGTAANSEASTPSGQTPSTSPSGSESSQTTTAFIAKPAKVSQSVEPSSSAAGDDQTVSG